MQEKSNVKSPCYLWNDKSFVLNFPSRRILKKAVAGLEFPEPLSAIIHTAEKEVEFVYTFLPKKNPKIGKRFQVVYLGNTFECRFGPASKKLLEIAKYVEEKTESTSDYRNLRMFRDYTRKNLMPAFIKKYFDDKEPISFYVKGPYSKVDLSEFSRHFNFYTSFFDRSFPHLIVHENHDVKKYPQPCLYATTNKFPTIINMGKIDPIILNTLLVARNTQSTRLKYLFYFQVLEYCAYYSLTEDQLQKLKNILTKPDITENAEKYARSVTENFRDYFKQNDDSARLERLLIKYCTISDVKFEIESCFEHFSQEVKFDGGFVLAPLIKDIKVFDNATNEQILKPIRENIERIRNVIVHLRETRENKVILPTPRNNALLNPYLFLLRRLAETIAFRYRKDI